MRYELSFNDRSDGGKRKTLHLKGEHLLKVNYTCDDPIFHVGDLVKMTPEGLFNVSKGVITYDGSKRSWGRSIGLGSTSFTLMSSEVAIEDVL